ncbi:hypothetical protein M8494_00405 [Serratia ureilytica]
MPQPASPQRPPRPRVADYTARPADRRRYADRGQPAPPDQRRPAAGTDPAAAGVVRHRRRLINSLPLILFAILSPIDSGAGETHRHRTHHGLARTCWSPRHRAAFPAARRHALAGQHPDRRRHRLRQRGAADAGEEISRIAAAMIAACMRR